jgi:predicted O-linked N-acetylglucosamine transferase (SPINDLY family)
MGEKKRRLAAAASLEARLEAAHGLRLGGHADEAQAAYARIVALDPACAGAWLGFGLLARAAGANDAGLRHLARAVALAPEDADARLHYAWALQDREDFDQSRIHWRALCALRPHDAVAWESLGIVEQAAGNIDAALAAYARAVAIEPTAAREVKLATAISPVAPSREAVAQERERMHAVLDRMLAAPAPASVVADPFEARLWTNFYLAYHGLDDRALQVKTAAVYRRICPSLDFVAAHCGQPRPPGRIRIGLISSFLRNHSIGRTSRGLFAQLSRERFEVSAIFVGGPADDAFAAAIRRDAEHSVVVPRDLAQARTRIAALGLDILFYQDIGMEPFTCFLAHARLAPVQCVSFGHPDTTGIPAIDVFVSNDWYEPPGAAAHYSERLFMLHGLGSLAYYYRPQLPALRKPRAAFGLADDRPLYLCPQNLFKVHPDMDDIIGGILRRDPAGVVALIEGRVHNWSRQLRRRWQRSLADVQSRIVFVPRQREDDYLNLVALADVMLDTVHFNGMNTSLEAFAFGVPVVTMPTAFQRGRHTQAMYRRMGLDDAIAADAPAYVEQAVRLGTGRAEREALSRRILERNAVLFEDANVVREFERCFSALAGGS